MRSPLAFLLGVATGAALVVGAYVATWAAVTGTGRVDRYG